MDALICCIREMVRKALLWLDSVYIKLNVLHNPLPDKTAVVSFVQFMDVTFLTLLRVSPELDTVPYKPYALG